MLKGRKKFLACVLVAVFAMLSAIICQQVNAVSYTVIAGYIKPDFVDQSGSADNILSGFNICFNESQIAYKTDANGYFEARLPDYFKTCTFWIAKPGYLRREIIKLPVSGSIVISPIEIRAGDFNGDLAINMSDMIELSKAFNTTPSNTNYNVRFDINIDNAVNMLDVIIVAGNFNKTASDYPSDVTYTVLPGPTSN